MCVKADDVKRVSFSSVTYLEIIQLKSCSMVQRDDHLDKTDRTRDIPREFPYFSHERLPIRDQACCNF